MNLPRLALAALALGATCLATATPRALQGEDLHRLAELSAPVVAGDGRLIAYAVSTADVAANRNVSTIWVRAWDGTGAHAIPMPGRAGAWQPAFLPDNRSLAFLAETGDARLAQVWIAPADGSAPHPATHLPGGVQDFFPAPDGSRVVVTAETPLAPEGEDRAPIVIDRFLFKDDERGYLDGRRRHLFVVDLKGGEARQLTHGDFDAFLPAWSPDGRRIAYVSRHEEERGHPAGFDVYCIDAASGGAETRVSRQGLINNDPDHLSRVAWSPDSRRIAYLQGGEEKWLEYAPWELVVADLATGAITRVGRPDLGYTHPVFSDDGRALYALVEESRNTQLVRITLEGNAEHRLTSGPRFAYDLAVGPGGRVALLSGDDSHPYRMSTIDAGTRQPQEAFLPGHNDWLDEVALQPQEDTEFRSADGTRIEAFLVRPVGYEKGRRYPTIVALHGGPQYQFSHEFMFNWQLYAARGYAVIGPNPRGSSGRGFEFSRAIANDWGHVDVQDVLAAADHVVALGVADPDRLAVGGWSYGGYLTDFTIATDTRFRAAVSGAGSGNVLAMYGTDEYTSWLELELGTPWKNLDNYLRLSYPFLHADRIRTPTLFLCGQVDFNVPCIGAEQMYQALRSNGVTAQLVIYPNMHHAPDTPAFALDRIVRYVDWYDRFLKAPAAATQGQAH